MSTKPLFASASPALGLQTCLCAGDQTPVLTLARQTLCQLSCPLSLRHGSLNLISSKDILGVVVRFPLKFWTRDWESSGSVNTPFHTRMGSVNTPFSHMHGLCGNPFSHTHMVSVDTPFSHTHGLCGHPLFTHAWALQIPLFTHAWALQIPLYTHAWPLDTPFSHTHRFCK